MTTIYPVENQPNDQFGYSIYSLVIPAGEELTTQVEAIRNQVGVTVASIPAHITVKGPIFNIASLEQVKQLVKAITSNAAPFFISFQGSQFHWGSTGGGLGVVVTPPLQALHDALVATISPLGLPAYRDDPYHALMTLVYGQSPEKIEEVKEWINQMDFGPGIQADAVNLVGRVGPRVGGQWMLIERFALGGI